MSQSERAGEAVERDEVRVIGHHEHAIAGDGDAAIDAAAGVAGDALRARPLVVPQIAGQSPRRARSTRWRS